MSEEKCDVDDILCQIEALRSMKSLKTSLGNERFIQRFPQLEGMEEVLTESIRNTEGDLKTALARCGNIPLEEVPEILSPGEEKEQVIILEEE